VDISDPHSYTRTVLHRIILLLISTLRNVTNKIAIDSMQTCTNRAYYIQLYSPYMMVEKKKQSVNQKTGKTIIRISTQ